MSFCRFLTNTYHFSYDVVKPCCWFRDDYSSIKSPEKVVEKFKLLHEINDWIPECGYCHDLESAGTQSPRTISLKNESIFSDDPAPGDTIKIELQLDEECNAACIMCNSSNSTTWRKYTKNTVRGVIPILELHKTTVEERIESVLELVDFNKVRQVHFYGGEPFSTDTQLTMLREIAEPHRVKLVYVTNGSYLPDEETLERWKSFESINLMMSIDGIGEHFNYLRWPLKWHQVESNLRFYRDLLSRKNFTVNSSFTGSPLNLFFIDRYTEWSTEFFKGTKVIGKNWFMNPHPVDGVINMSCVPDSVKDAVVEKYGRDSRIAKIIGRYDQEKFDKFIEYLEFHDGHRGLDFREIFKQVADHFPERTK
jgi:hypothetical protein